MTNIEHIKVTADQAGPGALHGKASVVIQTYDARRLIFGRRSQDAGKNGIVGLMQFAGKVHRICEAAKRDDPYADWYLVQLEEAILRARDQIRRDLTLTNQHITNLPEGGSGSV